MVWYGKYNEPGQGMSQEQFNREQAEYQRRRREKEERERPKVLYRCKNGHVTEEGLLESITFDGHVVRICPRCRFDLVVRECGGLEWLGASDAAAAAGRREAGR